MSIKKLSLSAVLASTVFAELNSAGFLLGSGAFRESTESLPDSSNSISLDRNLQVVSPGQESCKLTKRLLGYFELDFTLAEIQDKIITNGSSIVLICTADNYNNETTRGNHYSVTCKNGVLKPKTVSTRICGNGEDIPAPTSDTKCKIDDASFPKHVEKRVIPEEAPSKMTFAVNCEKTYTSSSDSGIIYITCEFGTWTANAHCEKKSTDLDANDIHSNRESDKSNDEHYTEDVDVTQNLDDLKVEPKKIKKDCKKKHGQILQTEDDL